MAKRGEVTYEVHVFQGGRWQMQARYQEHQMDPAIEDARNLDNMPGIEQVKVVKEEYIDREGLSKESIVYQTGGGRSGGRGGRGGGGKSSGGGGNISSSSSSTDWSDDGPRPGGFDDDDDFGDDDYDDFDDSPKKKKKKKKGKSGKGGGFVQGLVRVLLLLLLCIAISAALTGITFAMLDGVRISNNTKTNILSAVFGGSFLLSMFSMLVPYLRKMSMPKAKPKKKAAKAPPKQAAKPAAKPKAKSAKTVNDVDLDNLFDDDDGIGDEKDKKDDEEFEPPEEVLEEDTPEEPGGLSPEAEKQKAVLMQFLNDSLGQLSDEQKKMDSFNKFGVNLFMAGACENLGEKRGLDSEEVATILSDCVQVMGFKEADADAFAGKYEEYLLNDARYMQMFQSGRNGMNTYRTDEEAGLKHLKQAIEGWNQPKTKEEAAGPVTVLFTDIAGSTAMTQELGDAGAQQVVRAHNRVVREALTQHGGKEIKHTGDGIMASFSTTSNGVEAAMMMQQGCVAHNAANPNLPLKLKIGINAGEPISEDNDLFGTTVQMAARIVDKAQADQIFVSEIVRGICAGKPIRFNNRGAFEMKGFDGGVVLYEVVWQTEAAAAPAAAES